LTYRPDYAIVDVENTNRIIEGLRLVFVELPKFKPKTIAEKKMAVLWLRYLTEIDESTSEAPVELLENEDTRKALQIIEKSAFTEGQLYAYEQFWDAVVNERVLRQKFKREGYAEGHAEGLAEGHAEGLAEGLAEGKLEIAKSMKADKLPIETIIKYTGLSAAEIEAL